MSAPTGGNSFFCWGRMNESVEFVYDGVKHINGLNQCTATPLKGIIRMQENDADWEVLAGGFAAARELVR